MAPSSSGDVISPFHVDGDDGYDVGNVETEVLTSSPSDDKKLKSFGRLPSSVGSDEDIVNDKQPSQSSLSPSGKPTTPEVKASSSPSTFISSSSSVLPSTSLPSTSSSSSALLDRPQAIRASPDISEVVSANVVVAAARKRRRLENPISTTALPIAISSGGDGGITSATGSAGVRVTRSSTRRRRPRGSGRQVSDLSDDDNSGGEGGNNYSDIEEKRDPSSISRSGILTRSGSSTGPRATRQTRSGLRSSSISPTLELINSRNRTGTNTPTPSPSSSRTTRAPSTLREPSMRNSRRTVTRTSPIAQTGRTTRRSSGGIAATADLTGAEPPAISSPGSARGRGGQQLVTSASMISGQSHHHRLPSDSNGSQSNSHGAYYHQSQQRREYTSPSSSYTGAHAPAEYSSSYPPPAFDSTSSSARNDEGLSYSASGLGSRSLRQRGRGDEYEGGGDAGAIPYDDEGEEMERRRASSGSEYEEDAEMRDAYTDSREGGDRHGHDQRLQSSRSSRGMIMSSSDAQGGGGGRWAEQPSLTPVRPRHGAPIASYAPSASEYTLPPPRPSALPYGSPPAAGSGSGMMTGDQTGIPLLPSPHQLAQPSSPPHHHHVQQHPTPSASGTKKRGNLPREVTELLKSWILSHAENPYPTDEEKRWLCAQTGLTYVQVSNWMINVSFRFGW
jgi:hypothetical protein